MRSLANLTVFCVLVVANQDSRAEGTDVNVAERLNYTWKSQANYGPSVQGTLTLDGRDTDWRASILGFDIAVIRDGDDIRFALPASQGEFRGRVRRDRRAVDGFWIQPPGTSLSSAYATPMVLQELSKGVWVGSVHPLPDRISLYMTIGAANDGALSGFIRNPEFNFGLRRPFKIALQGNEVSFINSKREQDVLHGSYDPDTDHLSMVYQGVGVFDFARCDLDYTPGAAPRTPISASTVYRVPVATGDGWATAAPADVGMSADGLKQLIDYVRTQLPASVNTPYIHAILVARHGKLVFEEYFHGFDRDQPHDTRSAGKTLTSIMLGIAKEQAGGFDMDKPVVKLFPQYTDLQNNDERKARMTVGQLATMTSGLACDDNDDASPGNEDVMQQQHEQRDWYRYTLDLKMARDPGGKQAVYCSAGINLLGGIVTQRSGLALPEFFQRYVATPLQMERYHMNLMPTGEGYGGGGIYLRPRDALKLGQLYVSRGRWNNRQIVSANWVDESTRRHAQFDDTHGYGYAWHLHEMKVGDRRYREYAAEGNGGQFIIVVPELDLTVLIAAGNYGDFRTWGPFQDLVPNYIIPAITKPK